MRTAVVLFTRDLRVHDHPALHAACAEFDAVVPLYVEDRGLRAAGRRRSAGRLAFLAECLADLDGSLRARGGALVVRRGDVVGETVRVARSVDTTTVFLHADVTPYARRRERLLGEVLDLRLHEGHFVVPPGEVAPAGGTHYQVFSAYHRAWRVAPRGAALPAPKRIALPRGSVPDPVRVAPPPRNPSFPGGEQEAVGRAARWLRDGLPGYAAGGHDDLSRDGTSRLSPYLHFGCLSARALALRASAHPDGDAFVRQLCWRDFYAQLLCARPDSIRGDLRPRGDRWVADDERLERWKAGVTGVPLVDAGMRQLRAEGWMHNRARMVTASFLVKHLGIDWRAGVDHFDELLLDGDVSQNVGNWQWVAGTGVDTRPNRVYNPARQRQKLDPEGAYVRRWVPELVDVPARALDAPGLLAPGYPAAIVDHGEALAAFRARRGLS